jgi:hypothetical protein
MPSKRQWTVKLPLLLIPVLLLRACTLWLKGDQLRHVVFQPQLTKLNELLRHGAQRICAPKHGKAVAAVAGALCENAAVAMSP